MNLEERFALFKGAVSYRQLCEPGRFDWIDPPIIATEQSRVRLRRWAQAGMPDADAGDLVFIGDDSASGIARDVLEAVGRLPRPMRWYVCHYVAVIAIGEQAAGWCSSVSYLLGSYLITLRSPVTERLVLHECSHAWLHGLDGEPGKATRLADWTRQEKKAVAVLELSREWNLEERLQDIRAEQAGEKANVENQAERLIQFLLDWRQRKERERRHELSAGLRASIRGDRRGHRRRGLEARDPIQGTDPAPRRGDR